MLYFFLLSFIISFFLLVGIGGYFWTWSRSLSHTHSVRLLWTSDQPGADISTWQHATLKTDKYQCRRRDSKPQSQQARGHRPTP